MKKAIGAVLTGVFAAVLAASIFGLAMLGLAVAFDFNDWFDMVAVSAVMVFFGVKLGIEEYWDKR